VRRLNSNYQALVKSCNFYKEMMIYTLGVLHALTDAQDLHRSPRDYRCVACNDFGPFIYLPSASRCCYNCLYNDSRFRVYSSTQARTLHVLKEKTFRERYPITRTVPRFSGHAGHRLNRYTEGLRIVSVAHVVDAYQPKNKGAGTSQRDRGT
jgi:hypothetical protein